MPGQTRRYVSNENPCFGMRLFSLMFVPPICVLFLINLRLTKTKSIYFFLSKSLALLVHFLQLGWLHARCATDALSSLIARAASVSLARALLLQLIMGRRVYRIAQASRIKKRLKKTARTSGSLSGKSLKRARENKPLSWLEHANVDLLNCRTATFTISYCQLFKMCVIKY